MNDEIINDQKLPKDHPERIKIDNLEECLRKQGAEFSKLRMRFYGSTHRGVHAATNIKLNDVIVQIPEKSLLTEKHAYETPIGAKIKELGLIPAGLLNGGMHIVMATYLLTETYKKKADPTYVSQFEEYISILPADTNDFPACFTDDERSMLKNTAVYEWLVDKR